MATDNTKERATAAVQERLVGANNFHIVGHVAEFLDGDLVIVGFKCDGREIAHYVYVTEEDVVVYASAEEMARASNQRRERRSYLTMFGLDEVLNVGGIAGLIALLIAVTLCYIVVKHPETKIPDILSNALTVILGFYFGSKIKGRSGRG
jgi:hypothetical protein